MPRKLLIVLLLLIGIAGACLRYWPAAAGGALEAVVVEDAAHRTPEIGAILCDAQILNLIKEKQIAWRAVDPTDSGPDMAEVQWAIDAAEAKKAPLPALVLRQGGAKSKAKVLPLPETPAKTAAVLAAAAGP